MRAGLPLADRPPVSAMPSPILIGSAARATKTPAPEPVGLTSGEAVVTTRLKRPRARGDDDGVEPERLPGRARRRPDPRRRRGRSDHAGRRGLLGQPPADHPEPAQGLPGLEA